MLTFENPEFLVFLLLVPIIIFFHSLSIHKGSKRAMMFSNFEAIKRVHERYHHSQNIFWVILRITICILFAFAMAGTAYTYESIVNEADYILALDSSSSMLSQDVSPTRFEAAKQAEILFVESLLDQGIKSRVGLITFSGTTLIHAIPTYEAGTLLNKINEFEISDVQGTAMGEAIMNSVNLLHQSDKSKIMYLITDGRSNVGVNVDFAIYYAKESGLLINTIGLGNAELSLSEERLTTTLDEDTLIKIAEETGGKYTHVKNAEDINNLFNQNLGTTTGIIKVDLTKYLLFAILIMFFVEWIAMSTNLKVIP